MSILDFYKKVFVEHMNIYMMTQELSNGIGWTRIWWCAPKKFQVHILKCWFWKLLRTVLVSPFHAALLKPHKMGKRGCLSFFLLHISPALDHCTELTVVHPEIKTRVHVYHAIALHRLKYFHKPIVSTGVKHLIRLVNLKMEDCEIF